MRGSRAHSLPDGFIEAARQISHVAVIVALELWLLSDRHTETRSLGTVLVCRLARVYPRGVLCDTRSQHQPLPTAAMDEIISSTIHV